MANLGQQFDASQIAPNTFDVLPKGEYVTRIVDSDVVPTAAGTGTILKLTLEVLEGQYKGRKIFDQLNLTNPNEMAVKIGSERLSGYCHATGVIQLQDSQQLHGIPFISKVKIKVDKDGIYDDRNEIVSCKKIEQGSGAPAGFGGNSMPNGGAPAGFGGQPQQNGGFPQGQPQGGYGQFAQGNGQPVANQGGFQPQGQQAHPAQGQWNTNTQPQTQQVQTQQPVDNSPVPDMQFANGQAQGMQQAAQVNQDPAAMQGQAVQNGFGGQPANGMAPNQQQQVAQKAPWEQ